MVKQRKKNTKKKRSGMHTAYSGEVGHAIQSKSASHSGPKRPPHPEHSGRVSERSDAGIKFISDFRL